MENNLIEILSSILCKNNPPPHPQPENPYYPSEAYPSGQTMQNGVDNSSNNMLPLLLKLLSGGANTQSPLLNILSGSNPLAALISSGQKNSPSSDEFEVPHNDILL